MDKRLLLRALTPEAEDALSGAVEVEVGALPFRVGRESREATSPPDLGNHERRVGHARPNNDLYLWDRARLKHVSREHFQIEKSELGAFLVRDRGSACGTLVGSHVIGGKERNLSCELTTGNVIVVGSPTSPYVFQFLIHEEPGEVTDI